METPNKLIEDATLRFFSSSILLKFNIVLNIYFLFQNSFKQKPYFCLTLTTNRKNTAAK